MCALLMVENQKFDQIERSSIVRKIVKSCTRWTNGKWTWYFSQISIIQDGCWHTGWCLKKIINFKNFIISLIHYQNHQMDTSRNFTIIHPYKNTLTKQFSHWYVERENWVKTQDSFKIKILIHPVRMILWT